MQTLTQKWVFWSFWGVFPGGLGAFPGGGAKISQVGKYAQCGNSSCSFTTAEEPQVGDHCAKVILTEYYWMTSKGFLGDELYRNTGCNGADNPSDGLFNWIKDG